jgi:hypothetical protein
MKTRIGTPRTVGGWVGGGEERATDEEAERLVEGGKLLKFWPTWQMMSTSAEEPSVKWTVLASR